MLLIIVIVLLVLCFAGAPNWGYHDMGWGPSGILGTILVIIVILFLLGHLRL